MWRRLVFLVAALVIGSTGAVAVAAAPAYADSPPAVCTPYTHAHACVDVIHFSGGVDGSGKVECDGTGYSDSLYCNARIARLRLYVDGTLWMEIADVGSDFGSVDAGIEWDCSGTRHVFQVWMTYQFRWYTFGKVQTHEIDNYQHPLTSYPEYAC
jgi:hypothetical protein